MVNPKPKPPLPGGKSTFVIDTGPQPVPPGVPRVNLVPVGDGNSPVPLPPRRKRKPLLPSRDEIAMLPRWARVAFAARCARRVLPIVRMKWTSGNPFVTAVNMAEQCSFAPDAAAAYDAAVAAYRTGNDAASYKMRPAVIAEYGANVGEAAKYAAWAAALAADVAYYAALADPAPVHTADEAAGEAANAMLRVSSDSRDLLIIRSDFEWVREQAEENGWTDDTPVPPEVFGLLWPPGRTPRWTRETKRPRG